MMQETKVFKNRGAGRADYAAQGLSMAQYFVGRAIDKRIAVVGQQAADLATLLTRSAAELASPGSANVTSRICTVAAKQLAATGTYLKNSTGKTLSHDCEELVRAYPVLASSSAFLIGFAIARIVRSSSQGELPIVHLALADETAEAGRVNAARLPALI